MFILVSIESIGPLISLRVDTLSLIGGQIELT